jgi:hypothetical protein
MMVVMAELDGGGGGGGVFEVFFFLGKLLKLFFKME